MDLVNAVSLLSCIIGLLSNKVRDKVTEYLEGGDAASEAFRAMIVRDITEICTRLEGLMRKDLLASVHFFNGGLGCLQQVVKKASPDERGKITTKTGNALLGPQETKHILDQFQRIDLNESAKESLADAKDRFRSARTEATRAFSNKALSTSDRILALKMRLAATVLERVDRPEDALDECYQCLEDLNALSAVRENFSVQLRGSFWKTFYKKKREEIFVSICQTHQAVFRVVQTIHKRDIPRDAVYLPGIKVGDEVVDVLRNEGVLKELTRLSAAEVQVGFRSFDVEPGSHCIVANSLNQLIFANRTNIKVCERTGKVLRSLDVNCDKVYALATDRNDNLYALVRYLKIEQTILVWDKDGQLQKGFKIPNSYGERLAVGQKNVFVLSAKEVTLYNLCGNYICHFGAANLKKPEDITITSDGRLLVLDIPPDTDSPPSIEMFSEEGNYLGRFAIHKADSRSCFGSILFDPSTQEIMLSLRGSEGCSDNSKVLVYTKDGEFLCEITVTENDKAVARQLAVTADVCLAVICDEKEVHVVAF